jgi:hypothetical protein
MEKFTVLKKEELNSLTKKEFEKSYNFINSLIKLNEENVLKSAVEFTNSLDKEFRFNALNAKNNVDIFKLILKELEESYNKLTSYINENSSVAPCSDIKDNIEQVFLIRGMKYAEKSWFKNQQQSDLELYSECVIDILEYIFKNYNVSPK